MEETQIALFRSYRLVLKICIDGEITTDALQVGITNSLLWLDQVISAANFQIILDVG